MIQGKAEGAQSANGRVMSSYSHGMFIDEHFRAAFLAARGATASCLAYSDGVEQTLDALAQHLESVVDID